MSNNSSKNRTPEIILVGNPNTGKSTVFNCLTGLNQKIGNFPGITIEKKTGTLNLNNKKFKVVDLPGSYSLKPTSEDERVTKEYLDTTKKEDIVVVIADVTSLKRNLLICTQIMDQGNQVILALNMMDLLQKNNQEIDINKLHQLLGCPIVPLNARIGKGIDNLKYSISNFTPRNIYFIDSKLSSNVLDETMLRLNKISQIINQCITKIGVDKNFKLTKKIDHILTHKFYGYLIFISLLFIIFQAIFSWSAYPMDLIESSFLWLRDFVAHQLPKGMLNDLFADGIIAGLSGIVVFVPQIAILFAFITIMEDTGYMARVSFLMDRILRGFGLNGKSIIPILSSTACAVPAIMSARTINNQKERLITILVAPLMSCSARIPVYTLLVALVVPEGSFVWIFNLQGLMVLALYMIGFFGALFSAFVIKLFIKSKEKSTFTLEMPIYRAPRWKNVGFEMYSKTKMFVLNAGRIIIAISIVLWALSSFGPGDSFKKIDEQYATTTIIPDEDLSATIASEKLEASYAGIIGKSIEPIIKPLGFDWKIGIALITSFAAREVFVGTMATLYSVGDKDNSKSIKEKMAVARNLETGELLYTKATAFSLLIYYVFAMQCMATLAVVYRETNSIKWPIIQVLYMGFLAYFGSFITYHIFS